MNDKKKTKFPKLTKELHTILNFTLLQLIEMIFNY